MTSDFQSLAYTGNNIWNSSSNKSGKDFSVRVLILFLNFCKYIYKQ